jgi:hypothetical protein
VLPQQPTRERHRVSRLQRFRFDHRSHLFSTGLPMNCRLPSPPATPLSPGRCGSPRPRR